MTLHELRVSLRRARARTRKYSLAAKRSRQLAARRRKQIAALATGPSASTRWALKQAADGIHEVPAGSNRGPRITDWQQAFGSWLVGQAWCGTFVGTALKQGGVKGINSRVAAVAFIEDDARAGRNGFSRLVTASAAQPGDAVVLFGRGVHVELVVANHGTWLSTVGGNTSSGNVGSQANGGGVYARSRSYSVVHCVARPNWS